MKKIIKLPVAKQLNPGRILVTNRSGVVLTESELRWYKTNR